MVARRRFEHQPTVGGDFGRTRRRLVLETPPCDHAILYIYVVPHALPESNDIDATKPFALDLQIACDGEPLRNERLQINQWSGISLELRLER